MAYQNMGHLFFGKNGTACLGRLQLIDRICLDSKMNLDLVVLFSEMVIMNVFKMNTQEVERTTVLQ